MAEPTLPMFWTTFWQEQHKIFLQFYALILAQQGGDNKNCEDKFEEWFLIIKHQLLQNKDHALMNLGNSVLPEKHPELFINRFFEHAFEALDNFFSKIPAVFDQKDNGKYFAKLCDLWLSCHEVAYQKMIVNKEYQILYGQFINKIISQ